VARNTEFHLGSWCVWQGKGFDNYVCPSLLLKLLIYSMLEALSSNAVQRSDRFTV
jgi:hypothetical protein